MADAYSTPFATPLVVGAPGVLANDSDPDNSPLSVQLSNSPFHGTLSLAANGSFTYTPDAGFSGVDSFDYRNFDGILNSQQTTVAVTVAANQPPQVTPPANQSAVDGGGGVTFGPLAVTIGDEMPTGVSLGATSSNPGVISSAGLVIGGSGANRTIRISSVPNTAGGTATITLQASDGYLVRLATFTVTITPQRGRPQALTNLSARNQASLQWQAPPFSAEPVIGYVLEAGFSPGATAVSLAVGVTSFATSAPDGIYYVRVRSVTAGGFSPPSDEVVVALGQAAPPLAPLALLATVQGNTVTLQWTENPAGPVIAHYQLSVGNAPGASNLVVLPLAASATTFAASGPTGRYYVRMTAINAAGSSGPSNEAMLDLAPGVCTLPATPTGLQATVGAGFVTLRWTAPTSGAIPSTYRLEAGSTSGASDIGVFVLPQTSTLASPAPAGAYFVRLASANPCGSSAAAPELSFTVP